MRLVHFQVPLEGEQRAGVGGGAVCDVIPVGGYPCALPPGINGQPGGPVRETST